MRIQFLLCSILALSSADLYASGNDCWRLEELMLKSLTVENRQDFLKKLEAIEAFEQERLAAVVRELEADRKLFESWMRENTGKIEEQNSGEQKEAVAAITRALQRREKSLAEREAARKVILDMQGRLHEIDMRMGVFGWLSKAVGWNEDALRHNNYSAWKLQAEAKWIEADKELSRAQRELDRLGQNKTQSPVDSGERLRQEKERELAAKELVKRAEVSKEVQDRRADLEREIVRFMSDNDKLGTQLNAAYDRIYEAMCKAGSCLTKISQAKSSLGGAAAAEVVDLFSNSFMVSVLSSVQADFTNRDIAEAQAELQSLQDRVSAVQRSMRELTGHKTASPMEPQQITELNDLLDAVIDTTWGPKYDFSSMFSLARISESNDSLNAAAREVERIDRQLGEMQRPIAEALKRYNAALHEVALQVMRERPPLK